MALNLENNTPAQKTKKAVIAKYTGANAGAATAAGAAAGASLPGLINQANSPGTSLTTKAALGGDIAGAVPMAAGTQGAAQIAAANTPPTAPTPVTIPQDPVYNNEISGALSTYNDEAGAYRNAIQRAAMAYGDPAAMSATGLSGNTNPVGAIELAAQRAGQQSNNVEQSRTSNGTALSSLAARDANQIGTNQSNSDLLAQQNFNAAVGKYNTNMGTAKDTYTNTTGDALANETKEGVSNLPTITAVGGAPPLATSTSQNGAVSSVNDNLKNLKLT